jgi:FMN phosphatase YigB (HAD superfamily)
MKPLILVDIDRTIFDTDKFHSLYTKMFLPVLQTSLAEFETSRQSYSAGLISPTDFLPANYLKHLASHFSAPYKKLHRIYYDSQNFKESLYSDTVPALKSLKDSYILGIFSEGYPSFQKTKLKKSGIYDLFDQKFLHVHRRKTLPSVLQKLPDQTIIIDDKSQVIDALKSYKGLRGILIDRNQKFHRHDSVTSLSQLQDFISKAH